MKCIDFAGFVRRFEKVSDLIARLDGYRDVLRLDGLYEILSQLIESNPGYWAEYFWKEIDNSKFQSLLKKETGG